MGKKSEKEWIYGHVLTKPLCCTYEIQYCKSTLPQCKIQIKLQKIKNFDSSQNIGCFYFMSVYFAETNSPDFFWSDWKKI